MLYEPRTYRQSPIEIGMTVLLWGIIGIALFIIIDKIGYLFMIPVAGFLGIVFLSRLYSMTKKTILSDDEISTQTIFGAKSLRWSEITRVSGRGDAIKLHNFDGDVTVAPNPQLLGYGEVVEWIGIKRPDLFNPLEYGEIKTDWLLVCAPVVVFVILLFAAPLGVVMFLVKPTPPPSVLFISIFSVVFILAMSFGIIVSSPQSVTLFQSVMFDGESLFWGEKNLPANEIASVELRFTRTRKRNGKNYFVALNLVNRETIRISGLTPNLPVVYLVLKNWHKKNTAIGQTNQQN